MRASEFHSALAPSQPSRPKHRISAAQEHFCCVTAGQPQHNQTHSLRALQAILMRMVAGTGDVLTPFLDLITIKGVTSSGRDSLHWSSPLSGLPAPLPFAMGGATLTAGGDGGAAAAVVAACPDAFLSSFCCQHSVHQLSSNSNLMVSCMQGAQQADSSRECSEDQHKRRSK